MAGIYIHIPFCRKACHYCNFHFSTSLHRKPALVDGLVQEISLLKLPNNIQAEKEIRTVYLGGGTPSLLTSEELQAIFSAIKAQFDIHPQAEITLEANPDDINEITLQTWSSIGINRLSIGIQSFFDADLQWMNRAHNASQASNCIQLAQKFGFNNLTIDLIYGTPTLTDENWKYNVDRAIALGVNHLSCYALTVEENTALDHFIKKGKVPTVEEEKQGHQFELLMQWMQAYGFDHYEISNFAKPGFRSQHNSNYWSGVPYYGFGPSAHSFDGNVTRWWNIANNAIYIDKSNANEPVFEIEQLSSTQRLNEKIMTSLRTVEGLTFDEANSKIAGIDVTNTQFQTFKTLVNSFSKMDLLAMNGDTIVLTNQGKLYADGIASKLFV